MERGVLNHSPPSEVALSRDAGAQMEVAANERKTLMLEILVVINLCKKMGALMREKGFDKPFWFQFFVPIFWLGGECFGAFVYGIQREMNGGSSDGFDLKLYLVSIVAAALSAGLYFTIAKSFRSRWPEES
jgi:hypothetical protein